MYNTYRLVPYAIESQPVEQTASSETVQLQARDIDKRYLENAYVIVSIINFIENYVDQINDLFGNSERRST